MASALAVSSGVIGFLIPNKSPVTHVYTRRHCGSGDTTDSDDESSSCCSGGSADSDDQCSGCIGIARPRRSVGDGDCSRSIPPPGIRRGSGGDPRGSEAQTGDPTVPRPTFRGGSAATDFPVYNIKKGKRPEHGSPQGTETSRAPLIPRPVCERETSRILSPADVHNVMTSGSLECSAPTCVTTPAAVHDVMTSGSHECYAHTCVRGAHGPGAVRRAPSEVTLGTFGTRALCVPPLRVRRSTHPFSRSCSVCPHPALLLARSVPVLCVCASATCPKIGEAWFPHTLLQCVR